MFSNGSPSVHTLVFVTAGSWVVFEIRQAQQRRPEANAADRRSQPVVRLAYMVGIIGAVIVKNAVPSFTIKPDALASWVGLVVMWCGIGLRLWSFRTLGRYFTFTVQTSRDQPVIASGPYRVIRHPGYAGALLAFVGLGLLFGNWASLAVLIVAVSGGFVYRITIEERALSRELGGRYQAYAESRKRLVPFIW